MARSDLMKFWKLLSGAKLTGSPSKLTEDDALKLASAPGWFEPELEAVPRGCESFRKRLPIKPFLWS